MYRFLLSRTRARFRALAILISLLAAAAAPQSWGLGLGEIELKSALNQKFNGTIELFDASGLEPGEIIVSLGSTEDFDRVGVERFFFLTDLDFSISYGPNGQPQVTVTSGRPITEPYLNFLVEILWPSGRMLKEYTVLLDPPTFSEAAAPQVSAPSQNRTAGNTGRVQRVEPARSGTRVQLDSESSPAGGPSPLDDGFTGDEYGMTDRDDTLWTIALQTRPSRDVSVHQTMLAIQALNPEAFINGNINLLKAGYVLRLPSEAQARALSAQEAIGEVARHEQEWKAYNRGETVAERSQPAQVPDSTSDLRSPVDASSATTPANQVAASDGELKIVAEDGDSTTGVAGQLASADLDAALEETDRLGRQVDELTYALDREKELATNEISVRDRQLEVKDQQIAELQAQLAEAQQQAAAAGSAPQAQNQNQSTQAETTTPWWQSPLVMYGGAGILVLLLAGGMITARKRRLAEAENDYFDAEDAFAEEDRVEPALASLGAELEEDDDTFADEAVAEADDEFDADLHASQTSDVIGEADIYIAYGRFPQAIGLLLGVLEDEPERNDVRMKLLEVYTETGDRKAFDQHMTALLEYCDDEEALLTARDLENQFGEETLTLDEIMTDETATDDDKTVINVAAGAEQSATAAADEQDVPDLEVAVDAKAEADDAQADTSLDFELELDELESAEDDESQTSAEGAGDQLGGDLGIDFDPEKLDESSDIETLESSGSAQAAPAADDNGGFADADELTIDADLEEAAAGIRSEAGALDTELDDDVAVDAAADEDLLKDLEFESATRNDDDFDFEDEGDSANTKLDLARAYIDMGDADGARDILKEVMDEGSSDQQQKAQTMLEAL